MTRPWVKLGDKLSRPRIETLRVEPTMRIRSTTGPSEGNQIFHGELFDPPRALWVCTLLLLRLLWHPSVQLEPEQPLQLRDRQGSGAVLAKSPMLWTWRRTVLRTGYEHVKFRRSENQNRGWLQRRRKEFVDSPGQSEGGVASRAGPESIDPLWRNWGQDPRHISRSLARQRLSRSPGQNPSGFCRALRADVSGVHEQLGRNRPMSKRKQRGWGDASAGTAVPASAAAARTQCFLLLYAIHPHLIHVRRGRQRFFLRPTSGGGQPLS